MKKNMKKRLLKYSLFSLLLCITLLFSINLKSVKAVDSTETIKAGTYRFNETIIEPTFEGTFDLPTKVELELSSSDIIELNNVIASIGLSVVVQDYFVSCIYDSWIISQEISQNQDFSIFRMNRTSYTLQPYDEALYSYGDTLLNPSEVYNSHVSNSVSELFTYFTITEDTEASVEFYEWFTNNTTFIDYENITGSIFNVFTLISSWISSVVLVVVPIMWTGTELTTLGILAVCGLAVSVILLLIALISRFLKFRG